MTTQEEELDAEIPVHAIVMPGFEVAKPAGWGPRPAADAPANGDTVMLDDLHTCTWRGLVERQPSHCWLDILRPGGRFPDHVKVPVRRVTHAIASARDSHAVTS